MGFREYVTDQDLDVLLAMRDRRSEDEWEVGRFILDRIEVGSLSSHQYGILCKAVGAYLGLRSKDVREIVRVVEWGQPFKERYPTLSFEYFRRAAVVKDGEAALEWAEKELDELGRPASVDALLAVYGAGEPKPEAAIGATPGAVVAVIKHATGTLRRALKDRELIGLLPYLDQIERDLLGLQTGGGDA